MEKSKTTDRRRATRFLLAAIALMTLAPYLGPRLSPETALGAAAFACLAAIGIIRRGAARMDWLHPLALFSANFFLLFVANCILILLGISFIITNVFGPAPDGVYELMNRATLYATGFLLAVYAGYLWRRSRAGGETQSMASCGERLASLDALQFRRLRMAAWLSLGCSYLGCAILTVIFGGVGIFLADPLAVTESRGAFWPMALIWASLWSFGIFYISYVRERRRIHLLALSLTLPTMLFEFIAGGTKMAIIVPVVCYLILRNYLVRRLNWKFIPGLAAFTLVVFLVGYSYRGAKGPGDFAAGVAEYNDQKGSLFATFFGRFYGTDSFMVVLDATDEGYPLQHGKTLADLLYFYVPRAFWPGKPESYSMFFGREFLAATSDAGESFFTPSLPGELYLNFGVMGLLVGGLLTGQLLWDVYFQLILWPDRGVERLLVYAIVMPYVALLAAGPISTVAEYIVMRSACFAVFYWSAGFTLRTRVNNQSPSLAPVARESISFRG